MKAAIEDLGQINNLPNQMRKSNQPQGKINKTNLML